jgi:hypothetical protein
MVLLVGRSTEHFEALQIGKHHPARGRLVVAARCTLLRIDATCCVSVNASSSPRHGQGHKEAPRRTFFPPKGDTPSYAKWREAGRAGFQIVPDLLFKNQVVLGLSPPTCPSCSVRLLHRDLDHIKAILDGTTKPASADQPLRSAQV